MGSLLLRTAESVSEGHPDKIADQISDSILDEMLRGDSESRVAVETLVKTGLVIVAGEVSTRTYVDIEDLVRKVVRNIGYDRGELGFDASSIAFLNIIGKQSADISRGVVLESGEGLGAGDQGIVFGYASQETPAFMPAPIYYAHRLMKRQAELRKNGTFPWMRPDAKSQVTLRYDEKGSRVLGVDTVVFSTQHDENISHRDLTELVKEQIIKPAFLEDWLFSDTKYYINPTGRFVIGGPVGDCGLTGRKIIVDTYGGEARHGGGAFSGKDPSKVDRSASYAARYVAKNIVAAKIAKKCEVSISYAIGVTEPVAIAVDTFGTGNISDTEIIQKIRNHFDLTPAGIIKTLDLKRPIYQETAVYGHFGKEGDFPWERIDKVEHLC